MRANGSITRRVAFVFALLLSLSLFVPLTSFAAPGGNSANAKLCQQGGWTTLAPSGSSVGFASQDECVSYGAQGGQIVQLAGFVIPAGHSATISGFYSACDYLEGSYTASNGESGGLGFNADCNGYNPFSPVTTSVFANGVVLDISLIDYNCWATYDQYGNHALITVIDGGYQVDIMDSGNCAYAYDDRFPSAAGGGNFSVQIIIN